MRDFTWVVPTRFVFGHKAEEKVGSWAAEQGFHKAMVVYGGHHAKASGLLDTVMGSLDAAGVEHVELGGVRPNPEVGVVREGVAKAKEAGVDLMVAIGGGSVMDCSKAIALGALYDGDVWDLYDKPNPVPTHRALPLAAIVTIPASGSEASDSSVISNDAKGLKSSCKGDFIRPKVAFMDPELTVGLPPYQTAAGITDMCAHIMERFFSSSEDVPATDGVALSLLRSIRTEGLHVMRDPSDYDARANIMWLGTMAHDGLCACGRTEDWISHGLEHELSAKDPSVTHGAGLAIMFPAWMRYCFAENPRRFVQFGHEVFGLTPTGDDEADARSAIDCLQDFFVSLGMPRYLDELGFVPTDVEGMLPTLVANKGETFGSFKRLTADDARKIYLSAFRDAE